MAKSNLSSIQSFYFSRFLEKNYFEKKVKDKADLDRQFKHVHAP